MPQGEFISPEDIQSEGLPEKPSGFSGKDDGEGPPPGDFFLQSRHETASFCLQMYRLNNFTTRVLRLQGGEGENLRRGAANGAGMRPRLFFGLRPKKSRRRSGGKERRLGAKRHVVPYLLMIRGFQQETAGKTFSRSVGRGPSSSQSPYPSLPAYAESSLIPMLVLSPRKPLRWVFARAPDLLRLSGPPPATDCLRAA